MPATQPHLFLTGYRGTGKSTVARLLAHNLACPLWDVDREIEQRSGETIKSIFENQGETVFRQLEAEAIQDLASREPSIIALGGGAILRNDNRQVIRRTGLCVWLTASPETLASRIQGDTGSRDNRPALTSATTLIEEVRSVLNDRIRYYAEAADMECSTESITPEAVADQIESWFLKQARAWQAE
jgi:shikimate kinase